ncbi:odorant receptor 42a-like [Diorhabda sublineata]|uniref:odorant receptor 42a-like n=1 Tax=Diorhabda sublineata TaxID=1163346 RepID=UPI0024E07245|nr:odorant receptor 42a-like [Diorhabda sublineata]
MEKSNLYGYPDNFFYPNSVSSKLVGMWIPSKDYSLTFRFFYMMYVIIIYGEGSIFLLCELLIFNETKKKVSNFITYIEMLFTHMVGGIKFFVLILGRNRIRNLMNSLQDVHYFYEPINGVSPGKILSDGKNINSKISKLTFVMYICVGVSAHISSDLILNNELKGQSFENSNKTCADYLPYFFKIPFSVNMKWQCELALALMDMGLIWAAAIIACYDGIFVALLNCLRCQLSIVCHVFRSIRQRSLKSLGLPETYSLLTDTENPELEKEIYKQLSHTTEHLKILLRAGEEIETLFTFVTLSQTLASLLIFASCLYMASSVPMDSPEFFSQMEYFSCVLLQLMLFCYFGNEITSASEEIRSALFECDWMSGSTRFKKSIVLTMIRMQRPLYLTIGKFSPLTLSTIVAVCRGSFSYFALFKSVQGTT